MTVRRDEHKIAKRKIWMQSLHKNNGQTEDTKGLLMQVLLFLSTGNISITPRQRVEWNLKICYSLIPNNLKRGREKGFLPRFLLSFCCELHGVCQFMVGTCLKFDFDFFLFPSERCLGQHHQGHTKA
ncbi:hypothetical protein CDAR_205221 [Caerostris darwini]|uniref:Uncharacterized protein n=1 Tax=Caerostris darwini TaxID=1538125 RepID=A0AAV4WV76_9ARAC|nr:hypothetical protein CDAR_205221 [Caerostris darwini]